MAVPPLLTTLATQAAIGGGLFCGVVKFFDTVGDRLNEDTRLGIALWLLDAKVAPALEPWPATFAKVFDRVFGERHLSWKCFSRSCMASGIIMLCVVLIGLIILRADGAGITMVGIPEAVIVVLLSLILMLIDYLSLLKTRWLLRKMAKSNASVTVSLLIILGDALVLMVMVVVPTNLISAVLGSIWLCLYAGAGFLLKGAQRFDWLVAWMNAHLEIEKKPLQSIGLVAGAIVFLVYWAVVAVMRWV
jgi:hypothetical protein